MTLKKLWLFYNGDNKEQNVMCEVTVVLPFHNRLRVLSMQDVSNSVSYCTYRRISYLSKLRWVTRPNWAAVHSRIWDQKKNIMLCLSRPQEQSTIVVCYWPISSEFLMMTSSNGNIFRVTGHLCGEFTGPGEFPTQRPVTRSFDVFFDLRSNKRLNKQWRGWWFQTQSCPLWRHRNVLHYHWNTNARVQVPRWNDHEENM